MFKVNDRVISRKLATKQIPGSIIEIIDHNTFLKWHGKPQTYKDYYPNCFVKQFYIVKFDSKMKQYDDDNAPYQDIMVFPEDDLNLAQ